MEKYIIYLDENNLYGWAMSQYLPTGKFRWMTDKQISKLDLSKYTDDSKTELILDVDLEYPYELHDLHNDFPLAPQNDVDKIWIGPDHGSDHGPDHGPNHEPDHGSDYASDHGPDHGSDHGPDHGQNHGSDHGSDQGKKFKIQNFVEQITLE